MLRCYNFKKQITVSGLFVQRHFVHVFFVLFVCATTFGPISKKRGLVKGTLILTLTLNQSPNPNPIEQKDVDEVSVDEVSLDEK